jgi:hypothetical protein
MALAEGAHAGLSYRGERLRQQVVEGPAVGQPLAERCCIAGSNELISGTIA